ncbi:hypothetical protein Nepgr_003591 [Nepenthes gracilis]|uniref:Uncharacterized protein n=1 Tax=Nepenthes gracilis TaxID=150966 RepID=A0AAD3XDW8_NEPGR|nr:hypothetical protein Nepgr_003591 [Nepenthes gracilis]
MKKKMSTISPLLLLLILALYSGCGEVACQGIDISCGSNVLKDACNDANCNSICHQYVQSNGRCVKNTDPPPQEFCWCQC